MPDDGFAQPYIEALLTASTRNDVLDASIDAATEVLEADAAHVIDLNGDGVEVLTSTNPAVADRNAIPVATDLVGQLDLIGRSHVFDDLCDVRSVAAATPSEEVPDDRPRSLLVVPIDGVGHLVATDPTPASFSDADREWAERLADFVASLLEGGIDDGDTDDTRLERITTILSHDFTGPLTVVRGSLELAEETGDPAYFERAHKALDRIEHLVNGIERMAVADEAYPRKQPIEVRTVAEEVWPSIDHDGTTLEIRDSRTVFADEHALAQLLTNLLANAVEHGGETVAIDTIEDGFVVEDDGPGIDDDIREDLFTWGSTTDDGHKGIGLSIAEQIAAIHGWHIEAVNAADGGARFKITGVDTAEH